MRANIKLIKAEIKKQHQNWFHSIFIYFTLLLWPILIFVNAYLVYKPFYTENSYINYFGSKESLILFLITGFLGYNCFWAMVQSAWQMGFERQSGTLETIFLTPANKLTILYGRVFGAILENIWMFSLFSLLVIFVTQEISFELVLLLVFLFVVLILSASVWGAFMNVLFLFSRDATFLFSLLDEPMVFFSGVRIPVSFLPIWCKAISVIFPLTHTLVIIRDSFIDKRVAIESIKNLSISLIGIAFLTWILLRIAEKNVRKTGSLSFY